MGNILHIRNIRQLNRSHLLNSNYRRNRGPRAENTGISWPLLTTAAGEKRTDTGLVTTSLVIAKTEVTSANFL